MNKNIKCYFISVYDALTGEIVKTLHNQKDCVRDVSWHPNLNEIIGSSWDKTIVRWTYRSEDEEDEGQEKKQKRPRLGNSFWKTSELFP